MNDQQRDFVRAGDTIVGVIVVIGLALIVLACADLLFENGKTLFFILSPWEGKK